MSGIKEKPTKYIIYTWQPSGSLNDSDGKTSVLKNKKISKRYSLYYYCEFQKAKNVTTFLYDKTSNNIPLKLSNNLIVYAGSVNLKLYPKTWEIDSKWLKNDIDGHQLWDENQIPICDGYSLATTPSRTFVGQPVEFIRENVTHDKHKEAWHTSALWKFWHDGSKMDWACFKWFRDDDNAGLGATDIPKSGNYYKTKQTDKPLTIDAYLHSYEETPETDTNSTDGKKWNDFPIKINVTNNYNRSGNINITYKTPKHLVVYIGKAMKGFCKVSLRNPIEARDLNNDEIETGQWIVCSKKSKLEDDNKIFLSLNLNEHYTFDYQCLKTEPYSTNDENQNTCVVCAQLESYINPLCRYDKFYDLYNYNDITSAVFNKMNMVYNQKNNFFVFSGITEETVTDDSLENTGDS